MTMTTIGFDARDRDIQDEAYFGPPPRFLVEDRPDDWRADAAKDCVGEDFGLPSLSRIKELLGVW
jgi:hypothetical protein